MSQRGFVVLCRSKPSLLSPSKQRPASRRSPPPPLWFSQRWGWISSISTFLLFCPFRVLILSSLEVRFQPCQAKYTWFVPRFSVMRVCVSLHVYVWVRISCLCIVCAGSYSRFMMMRVHFLLLSEARSLNTLSCDVLFWQDLWASLN